MFFFSKYFFKIFQYKTSFRAERNAKVFFLCLLGACICVVRCLLKTLGIRFQFLRKKNVG